MEKYSLQQDWMFAMNFFKKHIGDYAKKTGGLSMLEHGAYTLLMDACYDRERFPTEKQAIEWTWARTDEEIIAVKFVLERFFELNDNGEYIQNRIAEELDAYHAMADRNSKIAKDREEKRRKQRETVNKNKKGEYDKAHDEHKSCTVVNEALPNQEPLTTNQEPLTISNSDGEKELNIPFDIFWQVYAKSVAKGKCESKWSSLSNKVREQVMQHLPAYIVSTPVKKFRKDPYTYLNNEGWLDDIIANELPTNQQAATYSNMNVNAKYDDPNHDPLGGLFTAQGAV